MGNTQPLNPLEFNKWETFVVWSEAPCSLSEKGENDLQERFKERIPGSINLPNRSDCRKDDHSSLI